MSGALARRASETVRNRKDLLWSPNSARPLTREAARRAGAGLAQQVPCRRSTVIAALQLLLLLVLPGCEHSQGRGPRPRGRACGLWLVSQLACSTTAPLLPPWAPGPGVELPRFVQAGRLRFMGSCLPLDSVQRSHQALSRIFRNRSELFSRLRQALPYLSHAQLVQCSSHFGQPLP